MLGLPSSVLFLREEDLLVFLCIFHVTAHNGDMYLLLIFIYIMVVRQERVAPWRGRLKVLTSGFSFLFLMKVGAIPRLEVPGMVTFSLSLRLSIRDLILWFGGPRPASLWVLWACGFDTEDIDGGWMSSLTDVGHSCFTLQTCSQLWFPGETKSNKTKP